MIDEYGTRISIIVTSPAHLHRELSVRPDSSAPNDHIHVKGYFSTEIPINNIQYPRFDTSENVALHRGFAAQCVLASFPQDIFYDSQNRDLTNVDEGDRATCPLLNKFIEHRVGEHF